jgi:hypothetical protein
MGAAPAGFVLLPLLKALYTPSAGEIAARLEMIHSSVGFGSMVKSKISFGGISYAHVCSTQIESLAMASQLVI